MIHLVTGDVTVLAGCKVTIQSGAIVKFEPEAPARQDTKLRGRLSAPRQQVCLPSV
jgi:hypothetical protein